MSPSYVLGTSEYVMIKIRNTTPGGTFTPTDWTAQVACFPVGEPFDADRADWITAAFETVDGVDYAKVLLAEGGLELAAGKYNAFVKLTPDAGSELPIIRARGVVQIAA